METKKKPAQVIASRENNKNNVRQELRFKLDNTFDYEERNGELRISILAEEIPEETREKLIEAVEATSLSKRNRFSIIDETLESIHDASLMESLLSRRL